MWTEEKIVEIHYQATASEDINDLASAVVKSRVRESARALKLLVVTSCKNSINLITNPNPMCSH
jgi:hypothetical protein